MAAAATPTDGHAAMASRGARPQQDADAEVEREPAALREDESDEASDEAADPHRGVEVADSGASEVEQVERERDDEHEGGARDDGLRAVHADDESQVAVAENSPEPRAGVAEQRSTLITCRLLRACDRGRVEPDDDRRRPQEGGRVHDVHGLNVGDGEQEAAQRRAEEEADALDRARRDVGSGELAGIARQPGKQRRLRGAEARPTSAVTIASP